MFLQEPRVEIPLSEVGEKEGENDTKIEVNGNVEFEDRPQGLCAPLDKVLTLIENIFKAFYSRNASFVKLIAAALFCGGYVAYFLAACLKDFKRARDLFAITMFAIFCVCYWLVKKLFGEKINEKVFVPITDFVKAKWRFFKW